MKPSMPSSMSKSSKSEVQGEGDYDSARKYNEETHEYVESGKVDKAARDAAPRNEDEAESMRRAEAEGRSHAKGQGKTQSRERHATDGNTPGRTQPGKQAAGRPSTRKVPGR